jgi:hypothetical protein
MKKVGRTFFNLMDIILNLGAGTGFYNRLNHVTAAADLLLLVRFKSMKSLNLLSSSNTRAIKKLKALTNMFALFSLTCINNIYVETIFNIKLNKSKLRRPVTEEY